MSTALADTITEGITPLRGSKADYIEHIGDADFVLRMSHCFSARLAEQFDAVLQFDRTSAVEPLEPGPGAAAGEAPEPFPSGT